MLAHFGNNFMAVTVGFWLTDSSEVVTGTLLIGLAVGFGLLGVVLWRRTALLIAGIGLYGVLASAVVRRTREIGLRIALGARGRDVAALLGRETMGLLLLGAVVVGLLAFACARVLQGVLFGVTAADPPTTVASILLFGAVALLAAAAPLRRASRVEPMVALRSE